MPLPDCASERKAFRLGCAQRLAQTDEPPFLSSHNKKEEPIRKPIYSIGAIVIAAAAVYVWSHTALVPLQASSASSISLNQAVASEATTPISPTDMMMNHNGPLPAENWEPAF